MTKNELRKYAKSNIIPVDEFVANINDELKKQTQAWRAIATQFALASEQYGRGSKDFKHILDATGFGHTKVIKLIKIASDTRLNDPAFDTLSSWTLLYSISRCSNEQVTELKKLGKKQAITDALVKSVCNPVRVGTLSDDTMKILKIASNLNSGISIKPGNTIKAISKKKTIMMKATVAETFDRQICIYDLPQFIKICESLDHPTITFEDSMIVLHNEDTDETVRYPMYDEVS
jgi:hypothetical protein